MGVFLFACMRSLSSGLLACLFVDIRHWLRVVCGDTDIVR